MKAWLLNKVSEISMEAKPLKMVEVPVPVPREGEILIRVSACGVCHTELDEVEGRTPPPDFPIIPGHQVVGIVEQTQVEFPSIPVGRRVGVSWIHSSCEVCEYCASGFENLCNEFVAIGRDVHGGYAEYMTVSEKHAFPIPGNFSDAEAAPLLCAGAIGFRSLNLCNLVDGRKIGLTGFGASAHLVLQLVHYMYPHSNVYVFARSKNEQDLALGLGAFWAGDTLQPPPDLLDVIIDTTPAWMPVLAALEFLKPGGRLVINAIRKENADREQLLKLDFRKHLWLEKEIKSVANITSADVKAFLKLASKIPLAPVVEIYPFEKANQALIDIKNRKING